MRPASWREPAPPAADFFAAKGVLAALLDALRVEWRSSSGASRSCIPAGLLRSSSAGAPVGWLGELHPAVAAEWELDGRGRRASSSTSTP